MAFVETFTELNSTPTDPFIVRVCASLCYCGNARTKINSGDKALLAYTHPDHSPSLREGEARTQWQKFETETETEAMEEHYLSTSSQPSSHDPLSSKIGTLCPQVAQATVNWILPYQSLIKKISPLTCPQADMTEASPLLRFQLPGDWNKKSEQHKGRPMSYSNGHRPFLPSFSFILP